VTHHGSPCGIVGIGGSVGTTGVAVGPGVGGAETDGIGAIVGDVVGVGDTSGGGGAVGVAAEGEAVGMAVRVSVGCGEVAARPGRTCGAGDPAVADGAGEPLAGAGDPLGEASLLTLRVRLNPARATAIAREGPRSTYRVKEARPAWPIARPPAIPSRPPIYLVGTSYPLPRPDK
jgi:hypothetical protein